MRTLAQCTKLAHEVTYFVPTTFSVNQNAPKLAAKVLEDVGNQLAERFGGVTENAPAKGRWPSEAMGMVKERILPVTVYVAELDAATEDYLVGMAQYIKDTMSQESVMMVVDGQGYLV